MLNENINEFSPNDNFKLEDFQDPEQPYFQRNLNEGELHWKLKNAMGGYLKHVGCTEIKEEFICPTIRFDIKAKNPNNTILAVEIGEFNCPHHELIDRLRKSHGHVNFVLWVPYNFNMFEEYVDYISPYMVQLPGFPEPSFHRIDILTTGHSLYMFNLDRMFNQKQIADGDLNG